jgi:hypothetical protein
MGKNSTRLTALLAEYNRDSVHIYTQFYPLIVRFIPVILDSLNFECIGLIQINGSSTVFVFLVVIWVNPTLDIDTVLFWSFQAWNLTLPTYCDLPYM